MWKLLRNLLLAGALLAGVVKLLAWYEVGQDVQRLSAALAPAAQLSYGGVSAGLNGTVTLNNVALTLRRDQGAETYRAERAVFEAPHVFWLLKHALLAEDTWPARFGVALEGVKLPAGAAIDPHWFDPATLVPFENVGCAAAAFSAADFRKMDVAPGETREHGEFHYDADSKSLEATLVFVAPETASITLAADLRQFEPKMLRSKDALRNLHIGQVSLQYDDPGFLKRRNAFCAQRGGVSPDQFVEQHLAAVQDLLLQHGVEPGAEALKLYRRLVENGGRASVLSLPSSSFVAGAWFSAPPEELLRQLNVTARYGDTPPVMFRLSFAAPPQPADAAATAEATAPATPATPAAVVSSATAATVAPAAPPSPPPAAVPTPAPAAASPTAPQLPVQTVQSATAPAVPAAATKTAVPSPPTATLPAAAPSPTVAAATPKAPLPAANPRPNTPRGGNGLEEVDRAEAKLAPPAPTPKRASAPAPELIASEAAPPPDSTLALVWKPTIERLPAAVAERPDYDVIDFSALNGHAGRFVRLLTEGGKRVEGYVVSANETEVELRIREGGGSARFTVAKARIQQIQLVRRSAPPA